MRQRPHPRALPMIIVFLLLCGLTYGRFISDQFDLVSNGIDASGAREFLRLPSAEETYEQSYGFLPCTNLFLILVHGYLMFLAATYLSTGSELLLEILGLGIVGGLFLPILGALPDAVWFVRVSNGGRIAKELGLHVIENLLELKEKKPHKNFTK